MCFYFFFVSGDAFFGAFSPPFPEEEISDYIAHGPSIRVFTVMGDGNSEKHRPCRTTATLSRKDSERKENGKVDPFITISLPVVELGRCERKRDES